MGQLKRIVQLEAKVDKLEADVAKLKTGLRIVGEAVDKIDVKPESTWEKLLKSITQKTTKSEKTS